MNTKRKLSVILQFWGSTNIITFLTYLNRYSVLLCTSKDRTTITNNLIPAAGQVFIFINIKVLLSKICHVNNIIFLYKNPNILFCIPLLCISKHT